MKIFKKILSGIVDFVMILVVIFAIFVTIISLTSDNNDVSRLGKYIPLNVKSNSMAPVIKKGDFIVMEECNPTELKEGDVIAFFSNEQNKTIIKTHRIVNVMGQPNSRTYTTRGDNNKADDEEPVFPNDVVGKWNSLRIPQAGTVLDFVISKLGFLFVIVVPLLILFIYQIYKFIVVIIEEKNNSVKNENKEEIK